MQPTLLEAVLADTSRTGQLVAADLLSEAGRDIEALMLRLNVLCNGLPFGWRLGSIQGYTASFSAAWRQHPVVVTLIAADRKDNDYKLANEEPGRMFWLVLGKPNCRENPPSSVLEGLRQLLEKKLEELKRWEQKTLS